VALGAVAEGCWETVVPHLPELMQYLLTLLDDPESSVRQITCWTVGRYSKWVITDPNGKQLFFRPMIDGLLNRMLDNNKRVQEAAASAFAVVEESAQMELVPYIEVIVQQFVKALGKYKHKNMYILYDCIQTLAEHVGHYMARKDVVDILMPPLMERWKRIKNDSLELLPLHECLSFIAQAMAESFEPYSTVVFYRCINILHSSLHQKIISIREPDTYMPPNKDFFVTSLDLLSAIIQSLRARSAVLVSSARPAFFELLVVCLDDPYDDVKQSAYALLGDCSIMVFNQMHPYLPQIMRSLTRQLDLKNIDLADESDDDISLSVVNNACWSCGEIALQEGAGMAPYVEGIFNRLLEILQTPYIPRSLTENAGIALGRLGIANCDDLAPHLATFAEPFLDALYKSLETEEKDSAFRGFVLTTGRNPQALENCLERMFHIIAKWVHPSTELKALFQQLVDGYRGVIQDWPGFIESLPAQDRDRLREKYNI